MAALCERCGGLGAIWHPPIYYSRIDRIMVPGWWDRCRDAAEAAVHPYANSAIPIEE